MANVQKQFEQFHENIRVDYETLREKREIVLKRLRKHLKEKNRPAFKELLQGSYAMGMGIGTIEPLEYDMDVGLRFEIKETDYTAKEVTEWVFEAVDDHTDTVEHLGPCVRVRYASGGYHLDLVSYAWQESGSVQTFKLAHKDKGWRESDPPKLLESVEKWRKPFEKTKDSKTQTDQFRRVIRYLKRWNDVAIPREDDAKPTGLAFVLICADKLKPMTTVDEKSDDLSALHALANACTTTAGRIIAKKPTPEYEDVLKRLSEKQMDELKQRFKKLADVLQKAAKEADPVKACKLLRDVFGDDFPVPDEKDTGAKTAAPAIITSSSSA